MERDSVTFPVKLETVDNECLSCDSSVSEAQSVPHSNYGKGDPKTNQSAVQTPSDCIFSSSDRVPLTAAHSEDVPCQCYQGGSSSAEPVVESPSDNFGQEQVDRNPSRSKDKSAGKYQCKHCSYQTEKLQHFKVHRVIHTGVKPFACKQCLYTTADSSHLSRHIRTHSGVKPFACNQCSFTSAYKGALKAHGRIHSGVKPFACNQCSFTSAYNGALKAHGRIHSGVKPFACKQCSFTTAYNSNLKAHERIHSGVKPFGCDQCSYTTVRKDTLKAHERIHS